MTRNYGKLPHQSPQDLPIELFVSSPDTRVAVFHTNLVIIRHFIVLRNLIAVDHPTIIYSLAPRQSQSQRFRRSCP